jgi:hypothetical protein
MDETHIKTEANLALFRLRSHVSNAEEEQSTLLVMCNACDALDKGEYGARAVKALLDLWRELKLKDISGASITELRAVVDAMYLKSINDANAD